MKILFCSHHFFPDVGGIEVNSEILASRFSKAGHSIILLTWTPATAMDVFSFPVVRKPSWPELIKLHKWADLVFENNPCLRLAWPQLFFNSKNVVALNTWVARIDGKIAWQDKLKKWWLSQADAVISVSKALAAKAWKEALVIANPYRHELFKNAQDKRADGSFVFLGRLVSDKGVNIAIEAIAQLIASSSKGHLRLTIIGDGSEKDNLLQLTHRLGITENVAFKGILQGDKLVAELNKNRYMLVPSVWEEPFGNVALEGIACGCLPIVSDGGGLPEAMGDAGLRFPSGDSTALANAIENLLMHPELEERYRSHFSKHLEQHHPDNIAQKYLQVLESVYGK